jgi:hypothetical protein
MCLGGSGALRSMPSRDGRICRQLFEFDLNALVFVAWRGSIWIHIKSIDRADRARRKLERALPLAFVPRSDLAELFDAFQMEL